MLGAFFNAVDISVAIVLACMVGFVGIVGYRIFARWQSADLSKAEMSAQLSAAGHAKEIDKLRAAVSRYKYRLANKKYDLAFDDDEEDILDEIDAERDDDGKISDLVKVIYPKLPPSLSTLIDQPGLQSAIASYAASHPDAVASFIDKFAGRNRAAAPEPAGNVKVLINEGV